MRLWALIAIAAAALVFASAGGAGKPPSPSDYTQAEIEALYFSDTDTGPTTRTGIRVTPEQVRKAVASMRAKGMQVDEEGTLPFRSGADTYATAYASGVCWTRTDLNFSRGVWPYNRGVTEYRHWCATSPGGSQTYRSSAVDTQSGLCSTTSRAEFRISGGNGYRWTVVRTEAWFSCPGLPLNTATRQEWSCNTWGNCARVWDNAWATWE